jgi:hypothetical protein
MATSRKTAPAKKAIAKKAPAKKAVKAIAKKSPAKASITRTTPKASLTSLLAKPKKWKIYIESAAFLPTNSADGYVDLYQSGRRTVIQDGWLMTALPIPVGAKLLSISIHYTNTTTDTKMATFLRKHQDRHSPSGEIEMSFINLPNTSLPPDNYLTVTDTSFPDSGVIQDKFLHYISIPTGDWGAGGRVTVRGLSLTYRY